MTYAVTRPEIRSGDLLAWSHRAWGSWYDLKVQAVRFFTQSEFSHVGIAWCVGGRVLVLEAVQPRVRIFPLSKLLPCYWIPLRAEWSAGAEEFALERVGEPYSEAQAVLAFLGRLKPGADRVWECAEYARQVAWECGVDLGLRAVTSDLVLAAQSLPGIVTHYLTAEA